MSQPDPKPNTLPASWLLVLDDMQKRDDFGRQKYGTPLQPFNGRDSLQDLYEELLDSVVYARTAIYEREKAKSFADGIVAATHNSQRSPAPIDYAEPLIDAKRDLTILEEMLTKGKRLECLEQIGEVKACMDRLSNWIWEQNKG